jgi:hypothetical protein
MEGTVAVELDKAERENSPTFLFCSFFLLLRKPDRYRHRMSVEVTNRDSKKLEKSRDFV